MKPELEHAEAEAHITDDWTSDCIREDLTALKCQRLFQAKAEKLRLRNGAIAAGAKPKSAAKPTRASHVNEKLVEEKPTKKEFAKDEQVVDVAPGSSESYDAFR